MSTIEYGVERNNVLRMTGSHLKFPHNITIWAIHGSEPMALVIERATVCAADRQGVRLMNDSAGVLKRVYVNDWCKVVDCEGRESTISHGVYPADEFNRMVSRLSRARYETDWRPE